MKKSIVLLICTACIFFTCLTANAQQVQDKSNPAAGRGNHEIPKKPAEQYRISEDKNPNAAAIGSGSKAANNNKPAAVINIVDPDDTKIKPAMVPEKKLIEKKSVSTVAVEIPNTVLPKPVMTDMSPTITTTAPVKKKPSPVIAEQQKQN